MKRRQRGSLMKFELKAIFKNKLTWIFAFIIIVFAIKTVITLETSEFEKNYAKDLEWEAALIESSLKGEQDSIKLLNLSKEDDIFFNNEFAYKQWLIDSNRHFAECYRNNELSEKGWIIFQLKKSLCWLNLFSTPEKGYYPSTVIYKEFIDRNEKILKLRELPFDYEKLVDTYISANFKYIEEQKIAVYNSTKKDIEYYQYLLEHDGRDVKSDTASPLSYLSNLFSFNQLFTIIIGVMILLFSASIMIESKKNRNIQLVELLPRNKSYIIIHYYRSIFISTFLILGVTIVIPMLLLAIRHGVYGWKLPILVDAKGFSTFTPYFHINSWTTIGLGKIYDATPIYDGKWAVSSVPVFWPMWKFLIAASVVSLLKIMFLILVGFCIGLLGRKNWSTYLEAIVVAGITGVITIDGYNLLKNRKEALEALGVLLAKPKLVILDEPTNGLDPQAVFELREQMDEIRRESSSILFSVHQLGEVAKLADRVVILDQGEKIYEGTIQNTSANGIEYQMQVSDQEVTRRHLIGMGISDCNIVEGIPKGIVRSRYCTDFILSERQCHERFSRNRNSIDWSFTNGM